MSILPCKDKNGKAIKKDGLTKYRVRISYTISNPDGTSSYKQIEKTAYGKPQAQEMEHQLSQQAAHLSSVPGDAPATFSALVDLYLTFCATSRTNRASTVDKKREVFNHHVLPSLGSLPPAQISPAVIYTWIDYINSKDISLAMRQKIFTTLHQAFKHALKRSWIPTDPMSNIDNFRDTSSVPVEHQEMRFYTSAQYHVFIDGLCRVRTGDRLLRFLTLFAILFYTGARKGEANALKWSDWDQAASTLYIRRSVNLKAKGGPLEGPPKNASSYRRIKIPAALTSILADQIAFQQRDPAWSPEWYICGGPRPIPDTTIEKANSAAAEAAGLPHIRIHDFRHSHASLLIEHNINIKAIAARLGHARVEQTWNRYGHLYPAADDRIIDVLNSI